MLIGVQTSWLKKERQVGSVGFNSLHATSKTIRTLTQEYIKRSSPILTVQKYTNLLACRQPSDSAYQWGSTAYLILYPPFETE